MSEMAMAAAATFHGKLDEADLARLRSRARQAVRVLKAMANEHRLLILCQLVGRERSVGELVRMVGISQSALSQHLAKLRRDDLVRTRRQAQTIYYALASPEIEALIATLYELYCQGSGQDPEPAARLITIT